MMEYAPPEEPLLNRNLLWTATGFLLAAGLLGVAGSTLAGAAAVMGLRRHVKASGMPPSELALHHYRRAKGAARAGADSWKAQPAGTMSLPTPRPSGAAAPHRVS